MTRKYEDIEFCKQYLRDIEKFYFEILLGIHDDKNKKGSR